MKITEKLLKEMIEDVISEKSFGSDRSTRSSMSKDLAQRGRDAVKQTGVDDRERGIISRIEKNLTKLADLPEIDITSGNMFAVLKRLNGIIEKEIEKAEGAKQDEK